jgi:hypothetical protein
MWIALSIVSILIAGVVFVWRVTTVSTPTPDENDASRQHEVPGAHAAPPTLPD